MGPVGPDSVILNQFSLIMISQQRTKITLIMNKYIRQLFFFLFLVFLVLVGILVNSIKHTDYSSDIPQERDCPPSNGFEIKIHLPVAGINANTLLEQFPRIAYLDSAGWCDAASISRDLQQLDFVNPDSTSLNRELMIQLLSSDLQKRMIGVFNNYQPDSLIQILQWADKFSHYKEVDLPNAKVYRVVSRFWFNLVSNHLGKLAEERPSIKYDFKFKYLVSYCHAKTFSPPIGYSNIEKTINYFIDKNYSYIFYRFWNSTGWLIKLAVFFGLLLQVYAFWCVFKVHFRHKVI
jgi:hypothetical protein